MAVNQAVYPDKYKVWSDNNKKYELFTLGDIFYIEQYKTLPFGQLWDNSNVYTTFDPTNTNLFFGVDSSKITFEPINENLGASESPIHYVRGEKSFSEPRQVNLRMIFSPGTQIRAGEYGTTVFNWSNLTEEKLISGTYFGFDNPYGMQSSRDRSKKTTVDFIQNDVNAYLSTKNFMFVNDIKRENVFLGLALGINEINEDGTDILSSQSSVKYLSTSDEEFNSFLPGGSNFDKRTFTYKGKLSRIKFFEVYLYARTSEHVEDENFKLYYTNYVTDNFGENMNTTRSDSSVTPWKLRPISEIKIDNNIYYMNIDDYASVFSYSLFFYRNNYRNSNLFYGNSKIGYSYSISDTYVIYRGEEKDLFNVNDIFYPLSSTFEYDMSDPNQYDVGDIKKFVGDNNLENLETVNKMYIFNSSDNTKYIQLQKPFLSTKDIFHLLSSLLIPFTIINCRSFASISDITLNISKQETPNAYVGIRKEDGHVDGTWIPYEWGKTDVEHDFRPEEYEPIDPDYKPPEPVTPDDDGDINIGSVPLSITDAFTNCYVLNTSTVNYIGKNLWNGLGSQQAESGLTFGGMIKNFFGLFTDVKSETTDSTYRELALNTVLDYFVSLRYYPIPTLFSLTQAIATHNFSVGTGQEPMTIQDASGFGRPLNRIIRMSGGQLTRAELNASGKVYNSFLDYQPNTTATLYIPYCGTVELTPSQLLDCDTIDIVYALDIMTGALSAIAMKNGTASYPLAMLQGTCGFETLVSGSNKGIVELATSISNLRFGANTSNQIVQGLAGSAIGSASQNAENAEVNTQAMLIRGIASAYNAGTNMYNYLVGLPTMTGISPISAGSMSSLASTIMPQTAYIQLTKHSADIPTNFENTYGRTTNVYGSIGSYQGYLICGNPRLEGIPCTEHERDEIFSLLTTGVYVE